MLYAVFDFFLIINVKDMKLDFFLNLIALCLYAPLSRGQNADQKELGS